MASSSIAAGADRTVPPPSYEPVPAAQAQAQAHTISDLRSQIIANAFILFPRLNHTNGEATLPSLVVAKTTAGGVEKKATSRFKSEKQALANAVADTQEKHYALLLRTSFSKNKVKILIRGEAQDTVLQALEWVLRDTEDKVHQLAMQYGIDSNDESCSAM